MALTARQSKFCDEYLIDLNGTQAAIRSGYSAKTSNEQAARLLANVSIQDYIKEKQLIYSKKIGVDTEWILNRFKEISDRCMTAEPVMVKNEGEWVKSGEYQFDSSGANKATEMLAKHLGFFERDNSQSASKITLSIVRGKSTT